MKSFGKLTSTVANICQIIIVVLAIIEYNIHIKPTFQNQLLSEENARLIIENKEIKDNSEKIQNITDTLILEKQQELEKLQIELQKANTQLEETSKKLKAIETEQKKKENLARIKKQKEETLNSIIEFKKTIESNCGESRSTKFFNETKKLLIMFARKEEINKDEFLYSYPLQNIDKLIEKYFYNPYIKLYESLDTIQSENINKRDKQIDEYLHQFKQILSEKEKYIIYDNQKVLNLKKKLNEIKIQVSNLEREKEKSKDLSQRDKLFNEKMKIENSAEKMIQELRIELIDYKDIIEPVINEMISKNLKHYNN